MLENIKILSKLDKEDLSKIELFCQERFLKAGEVLFNVGDDANSMYLISKGELEVFIKKNGEEKVLGYIKAEDILGEMALFGERKKRMAGARAIVDSEVIVLLDFAIKGLIKNHPEILEKIQEIIQNRKKINKKLID